MRLTDILLKHAQMKPDLELRRVCCGPFWTVVELNNGLTGMSSTQLERGPTHGQHPQSVRKASHLTETPLQEVISWCGEARGVESSIGWATLQALLPPAADIRLNENAAEAIPFAARRKKVVMVGWFPFQDQVKAVAAEFHIFEWEEQTGYSLTADKMAALSDCELFCTTASALGNHTLDDMLHHLPAHAIKMMVGPSTPVCEAMHQEGWQGLFGARIIHLEPVIRCIQEGGCFRQIRQTEGVQLISSIQTS